jgi:hypothetical protein
MKKFLMCSAGVVAATLGACSLDVPKNSGGVTIKVEKHEQTAAMPLFDSLLKEYLSASASPGILATGPSSINDFGCFAVNVTGAGIQSTSDKLQNCQSSTNMHGAGVGTISNTFPTGQSVTLSLTSGTNRTIDIYGVFPPDKDNCPGAPGAGQNNSGGGGYFLGRVVKDLAADTTVTVPISYGGSTTPDVVCSDNGGNGGNSFYIASPFPYNGRTGGGWSFTINGGGFLSTAIVKVGGVPCASQTFLNSRQITCGVPASLTPGSYVVSVDNQNGQSGTTGGAYLSLNSSGAQISIGFDSTTGINSNLLDFGTSPVGTPKTIALNYVNSGAGSTSSGIYPSLSAPFDVDTANSTCQAAVLSTDQNCKVVYRFTPTSSGAADITSANATVFSVDSIANFHGVGQ